MSLVTVKPKFQVTIPAELRRRIGLREGDLLDATLVADGILLRPKAVVDHGGIADRLEAIFAAASPSAADTDRTEEEILADVDAGIRESRAGTR